MTKSLLICSFILILTGCSVLSPKERIPPIELSFASFLSEEVFNAEIAKPINIKYPHITLKYVNEAGKGMPPNNKSVDILHYMTGGMTLDWDYRLDYPFLAEDLTTWLAKQNDPTLNIHHDLWNHARILSAEGTLSVIPYTRKLYAFYYNTEQFAKYGITVPQQPLTWGDLAGLNVAIPLDRKDWFSSHMVHAMLDQLSLPQIRASYDQKETEERLAQIVNVYDQILNSSQGYSYSMTVMGTSLNYDMFVTTRLDSGGQATRKFNGVGPLLSNPSLDLLNFPVHSIDKIVSPSRVEEALQVNSNSSLSKKQAALDVVAYMVSEDFQVKNARSGLGPVIDSYEATAQFGEDLPNVANKNLQAFFTTNMAPYPEEGQLLAMSIVEDTLININSLLRQQLGKEIESEDALNKLKELFKVFVQ
jgi:ABC-type glycerol-3-phosphate transport system substrate-binding protein